jgi:two-component system, NtrC family, nitrogen regulation sensor histidine kinase NtrY
VRRRSAFAAAALCFLVLLALVIWQGSFRITYSPSDRGEVVVLWAVSTLIFLLTVTLAFMLFRSGVKLYLDRQRNREGSRIRSKLLFGALALTVVPALFSVLFSVYVLNRTLDKWFSKPAHSIQSDIADLEKAYQSEAQRRAQAEADWIALLPQTGKAAATGIPDADFFRGICQPRSIVRLTLVREAGPPLLLYQGPNQSDDGMIHAKASVVNGPTQLGHVVMAAEIQPNPSRIDSEIARFMNEQDQQSGRRQYYRDTYFLLICLLTLFVLFLATWSAHILARQISVPISALLGAAQEVRRGNLAYRLRVQAMDEMASLVRAFNEMTSELEGNAHELEARRRFTEAILQSIPTGVISVAANERIGRVNRALEGIFPPEVTSSAQYLEDLFSPDDLAEIRYLLKRARRTGAAACQLEIPGRTSVLHLAVTVASLEEQQGWVLVIEDTSDLLRAQKAAAWQEVARRIAHEIKNPLTPISLCADRIARQLRQASLKDEQREIFEECTQIIQREVQTVKTLVDEFSQFSRFPSAQLMPANLNEVVEGAMSVFAGRLENIEVRLELDPTIPLLLLDKEQFKRVIVNLVDNAAEAMQESPVRQLLVKTAHVSTDVVELSVTDTGTGVSPADKEKLFLPYFSTKNRGTGLGLAIVSHIIKDHHGFVRIEDNVPVGARFVVELSTFPMFDAGSSAEDDASEPVTLKA